MLGIVHLLAVLVFLLFFLKVVCHAFSPPSLILGFRADWVYLPIPYFLKLISLVIADIKCTMVELLRISTTTVIRVAYLVNLFLMNVESARVFGLFISILSLRRLLIAPLLLDARKPEPE